MHNGKSSDLFNQDLLIKNRNLAASSFKEADFLKQQLSSQLLSRLDHIQGDFELALDLMCHTGVASEILMKSNKVEKVICTDISINMLKQISGSLSSKILSSPNNLPFKANTFNLVTSIFGLHSINNLTQVFKNIHNILQKDGLILLSIPCFGNLSALSSALLNIDISVNNQVVSRVHPFMDIKTLANLLQEAGFSSIVSDKDKVIIMYKHLINLFRDLRNMGETNILNNHYNKPLSLNALHIFKEKMSKLIDPNTGCYKINVEVCNLMAWKK